MAYQTATRQKYGHQTTPSQSLWEVVFDELTRFFHHALGVGKSLVQAANHLHGLIQSGRTLWSLASQYLL